MCLTRARVAYYFVHRYIASIGTRRQLQQSRIVGFVLALGLYVMGANPLWHKMGIVLILFMAGVYQWLGQNQAAIAP